MDARATKEWQDQVREDILPWALLPYILASIVLAVADPGPGSPPPWGVLGMVVLAWAAGVWTLRQRYFLYSAWLLCLGSLLITVFVWYRFPESNAYCGLLLPALAAVFTLGPWAGLAAALLASVALALGVVSAAPLQGARGPLLGSAAALWGAYFMASMALHLQKEANAWAWRGYEQARDSLRNARDRQLELKQAIEDLSLAHREVARLNDLLTAAREAVEEARRAKEEFTANVSHELRTPLNMIIGFSDEILERPELYSDRLPPELLDDVAVIKRNSEHLARLVDDVLDLVEADVGFTRLAKDAVSIGEIVIQAREAVALFFEKKGLQLKINVQPGLPPVYCDAMRVRQVVLNLLSNAARFTDLGGATVDVTLQEEMIAVSVTDTGPGIEPATLNRLFEPFQQVDPSIRRRYGGTGLGLAISKRFVEMHGGRIWIESAVGVGTRVSFTLPLTEDLSPQNPKRWFSPYHEYSVRDRPSLAPQISTKPGVVVVEQGHALSGLIERYLDSLEAISVKTVQEAFQWVQSKGAAALIINDMPPANTPNFLADLPTMILDMPILFCWVPEHEGTVAQMGVREYLVKPIRRPDLLESMARIAPHARRILLVDDDDEARQLFSRMLSSSWADYDITQAKDGGAALTLMREWQPDLVLLDLLMPNQDGFAVLAAKANEPAIRDVPVIIISARDPQREPILSNALVLTRQQGLSVRDLMLSLEAIVGALPPRFGPPAPREILVPSPASE